MTAEAPVGAAVAGAGTAYAAGTASTVRAAAVPTAANHFERDMTILHQAGLSQGEAPGGAGARAAEATPCGRSAPPSCQCTVNASWWGVWSTTSAAANASGS
ncbi:hypothetical protein GCM10018987_19970 [Streptomyces cremeus]